MTVSKDAFQRFQDELAALETKKTAPVKTPVTMSRAQRLEYAKAEFLQLRKRYALTVADAVTFFPEEEGIAYLQELIAVNAAKPVKRKKV